MYHIYGKNPLACAVPSITIPVLFGEFVFPSCLVRLSSLLNRDFIATGCVVTRKIQAPATPRNLKSLAEWSSVGFGLSLLQVPVNPVNLLEIILT